MELSTFTVSEASIQQLQTTTATNYNNSPHGVLQSCKLESGRLVKSIFTLDN